MWYLVAESNLVFLGQSMVINVIVQAIFFLNRVEILHFSHNTAMLLQCYINEFPIIIIFFRNSCFTQCKKWNYINTTNVGNLQIKKKNIQNMWSTGSRKIWYQPICVCDLSIDQKKRLKDISVFEYEIWYETIKYCIILCSSIVQKLNLTVQLSVKTALLMFISCLFSLHATNSYWKYHSDFPTTLDFFTYLFCNPLLDLRKIIILKYILNTLGFN